jgi:hypothetical protein
LLGGELSWLRFYDYYISHNYGPTVNDNFYATYNFQPDPGTVLPETVPQTQAKKPAFCGFSHATADRNLARRVSRLDSPSTPIPGECFYVAQRLLFGPQLRLD